MLGYQPSRQCSRLDAAGNTDGGTGNVDGPVRACFAIHNETLAAVHRQPVRRIRSFALGVAIE